MQPACRVCRSRRSCVVLRTSFSQQWGSCFVNSPVVSDHWWQLRLMGCTRGHMSSCSCSEGTDHLLCREPYCWDSTYLMVYKICISTLKFLSIQSTSPCQLPKEQVERARLYRLLLLPAGSVASITWEKQEASKQLYQPPLCMLPPSSWEETLPRAWKSPKDGKIFNRNIKICWNGTWREASVCDQAPEEPGKQSVRPTLWEDLSPAKSPSDPAPPQQKRGSNMATDHIQCITYAFPHQPMGKIDVFSNQEKKWQWAATLPKN